MKMNKDIPNVEVDPDNAGAVGADDLSSPAGGDTDGGEATTASEFDVTSAFSALQDFDVEGGDEAGAVSPGAPASPASDIPAQRDVSAQKVEAPAVVAQPSPDTAPAAVPPAPAATQQPSVAEPAVAAQGQTPVPQQGAEPVTSQAVDATASSPFEAFKREIEKNEGVFTQALAETVYKLDDATVEELNTSPEVAVPKLLARSHMQIVKNVVGTIAQQIPAAIAGYMAAEQQNRVLEDKFFSQWPQLDREKDRATITQIAANFRRQNPNASYDDTVRFVGAQAVVMLNKLPVANAAPQAAAPQQVRQAPFVPAANGTAAPSAGGSDGNPWASAVQVLSEDFD